MGDFRIRHRHGFGSALILAAERPPPLAARLGLGLGDFDRLGLRFYLWFLVEHFLGAERPVPRAGTVSLGHRSGCGGLQGSWGRFFGRLFDRLFGRDFVGRPERPPTAAVCIIFRSLRATGNSEAQCQGEGGFG
ncbi:hypothetical protein D3C73_1374480 [compost metagenome]